MKVYVLYIMNDHACPIHMSIDRKACKRVKQEMKDQGFDNHMWIEEYDFSTAKEFELNTD